MAWKECIVKSGGKELSAYQRGDEISLSPADALGEKISSISVDGKNYSVKSSEVDSRGEILTITLELPNGSAKEKGEPDGESNEVSSRDTARK